MSEFFIRTVLDTSSRQIIPIAVSRRTRAYSCAYSIWMKRVGICGIWAVDHTKEVFTKSGRWRSWARIDAFHVVLRITKVGSIAICYTVSSSIVSPFWDWIAVVVMTGCNTYFRIVLFEGSSCALCCLVDAESRRIVPKTEVSWA